MLLPVVPLLAVPTINAVTMFDWVTSAIIQPLTGAQKLLECLPTPCYVVLMKVLATMLTTDQHVTIQFKADATSLMVSLSMNQIIFSVMISIWLAQEIHQAK